MDITYDLPTNSDPRHFSYTYDPNGNRLTQDLDGQVTHYKYNAADQLCYLAPTQGQSCDTAPAGATTFDYDLNGNLTSQSDGRSLAYNSKDQNTSFNPGGALGQTSAMSYLDTGQAERTKAGGATFSTGPLGLARSTSGGIVSTDYVRDSDGGLVSRTALLGTQYYLFDRLGSLVALTNAEGNAVNTYVYDPYGNHLEGTTEGVANPWQFAGGFKDSFSGYYKFGTRYYDPEIGRWTQPDPSGMEANAYAYAAGNPVNFVDPTGMFSCVNNRVCRFAQDWGRFQSVIWEKSGASEAAAKACSNESARAVTGSLGVADAFTFSTWAATNGSYEYLKKMTSTEAAKQTADYAKIAKVAKAYNVVSAVATAAEWGCISAGYPSPGR